MPPQRLATMTAVLLLLASACSDDAGNALDTDTANDTVGDATADADADANDGPPDVVGDALGEDPATDTLAEVPMIDEAELCGIPDTPRRSVSPGTDLARVTLDDPSALCNDGTRAVIYVSPAPDDSPDADQWIVWLEGGGGCLDPADCADRWCGRQGPIYSAAKMSAAWAPIGIEGTGIFQREPTGVTNRFAGFNMVAAYYCSSDTWSGTALQTLTDDSGRYPPFRLYFHGSHIVSAIVATLQAGAEADDGSVTLPSIDDASRVLHMGTSGGGGGARFNADRVAELLRASNADVDVMLVVDAGVTPTEADPPHISEEAADAALDRVWAVATDLRESVVDASCLEFHTDDPRPCGDNTHTLIHHITTPWYVKMDLTDSANRPGLYPDTQSFGRATFELLQSFADLPSFSEEIDDYVPGVFAPNCGHHVNLEVGDFYRLGITRSGSDTVLSNHDVLWNWYSGEEPAVAFHDPENGFTSVCP